MDGDRLRELVEFTVITWAPTPDTSSRMVPGRIEVYESGRWSFELEGFPPVTGTADHGERQIATLILQAAR